MDYTTIIVLGSAAFIILSLVTAMMHKQRNDLIARWYEMTSEDRVRIQSPKDLYVGDLLLIKGGFILAIVILLCMTRSCEQEEMKYIEEKIETKIDHGLE